VGAFSETLHGEFAHRGISITALCPGNTTTGFQVTADADTQGMSSDTPVTVAREGLATLHHNKSAHVVGTGNYLQSLLPRLLPRKATIKVVAGMMSNRVHR
jgi:short-subunit dehydrogenase